MHGYVQTGGLKLSCMLVVKNLYVRVILKINIYSFLSTTRANPYDVYLLLFRCYLRVEELVTAWQRSANLVQCYLITCKS